jgi:hypothetical protein
MNPYVTRSLAATAPESPSALPGTKAGATTAAA